MKRKSLIPATLAVILMIGGCTGKDGHAPDIYDNIIVYGKIYTAKVDVSKGRNDNSRYAERGLQISADLLELLK